MDGRKQEFAILVVIDIDRQESDFLSVCLDYISHQWHTVGVLYSRQEHGIGCWQYWFRIDCDLDGVIFCDGLGGYRSLGVRAAGLEVHRVVFDFHWACLTCSRHAWYLIERCGWRAYFGDAFVDLAAQEWWWYLCGDLGGDRCAVDCAFCDCCWHVLWIYGYRIFWCVSFVMRCPICWVGYWSVRGMMCHPSPLVYRRLSSVPIARDRAESLERVLAVGLLLEWGTRRVAVSLHS